jgi:hypothetical protein
LHAAAAVAAAPAAAVYLLLAQHKKAQAEAPSAKRSDKMSKEDLEAAITSLFIQQQHWHFTQIQVHANLAVCSRLICQPHNADQQCCRQVCLLVVGSLP